MYLDLSVNGVVKGFWDVARNDFISTLKSCFFSVANETDFITSFISELNTNFEAVSDVKFSHENLHMYISQSENEWNLTLSKYGLKLQSFSSNSPKSIIRKTQLSFEEFGY